MALFKKKEEKEDKNSVTSKATNDKEKVVSAGKRDLSWVLRKTRITEKSAIAAETKTYVFEISPRATKKDVSQAVKEYYKVSPIKVNIAKIPAKKVTRRTRTGTTSGMKGEGRKAYVFIDKKDSIEFV